MNTILSVVVGLFVAAALLYATAPVALRLAVCYPLAMESRVEATVRAMWGASKEEEEMGPAEMRREAALMWCRSWEGE